MTQTTVFPRIADKHREILGRIARNKIDVGMIFFLDRSFDLWDKGSSSRGCDGRADEKMTKLDVTKIVVGNVLTILTHDFLGCPVTFSGTITSVARRDDQAFLLWVKYSKKGYMSVIVPENGVTHKKITLQTPTELTAQFHN